MINFVLCFPMLKAETRLGFSHYLFFFFFLSPTPIPTSISQLQESLGCGTLRKDFFAFTVSRFRDGLSCFVQIIALSREAGIHSLGLQGPCDLSPCFFIFSFTYWSQGYNLMHWSLVPKRLGTSDLYISFPNLLVYKINFIFKNFWWFSIL